MQSFCLSQQKNTQAERQKLIKTFWRLGPEAIWPPWRRDPSYRNYTEHRCGRNHEVSDAARNKEIRRVLKKPLRPRAIAEHIGNCVCHIHAKVFAGPNFRCFLNRPEPTEDCASRGQLHNGSARGRPCSNNLKSVSESRGRPETPLPLIVKNSFTRKVQRHPPKSP